MAAIILIAITSIFLHGRIIEPGTEFACDHSHAKKLVDGGSARLKSAEARKSDENTGKKDGIPPGNDDGNNENSGGNGEQTPPENINLQEKLDGLLVPELKELAKKHAIQLDSDDKKAQIIEKIIASGVNIDEENI